MLNRYLVYVQNAAQRWVKLHNVGPVPTGRAGHAMASDGTRVFVLGGEARSTSGLSFIHVFDTSSYFFRHPIWAASKITKTEDIKYPDSEPDPNTFTLHESTAQLVQKSSAGPSSQEQPKLVLKGGDGDKYVLKSRHLILLLKERLQGRKISVSSSLRGSCPSGTGAGWS